MCDTPVVDQTGGGGVHVPINPRWNSATLARSRMVAKVKHDKNNDTLVCSQMVLKVDPDENTKLHLLSDKCLAKVLLIRTKYATLDHSQMAREGSVDKNRHCPAVIAQQTEKGPRTL